MSEEQLKAFLEKVKGNSSLQEKLKAAGDSNAVVSIAKDAGFSIVVEDVQSLMTHSDGSALDDDELEAAAAGAIFTTMCPDSICVLTGAC